MEWKNIDKELPEANKRILIYSPIYEITKNEYMIFRIIDSQFLKYTRDVKHWVYVEKPETNIDMIL